MLDLKYVDTQLIVVQKKKFSQGKTSPYHREKSFLITNQKKAIAVTVKTGKHKCIL